MWAQGEHVAVIGDTGSGKSYLMDKLRSYRTYWMFLRTKAEDPQDDPLGREWRRVGGVAQIDTTRNYWLIEPRTQAAEWAELRRMLAKARTEGSWTVAIDELYDVIHRLRGEKDMNLALTKSRSQKVSIVCGMQRPVGITRFALSQCTHAFIFSLEGRDIPTVAEAFSQELKLMLPRLNFERHEFVYYNRRKRWATIATARDLSRIMGIQ